MPPTAARTPAARRTRASRDADPQDKPGGASTRRAVASAGKRSASADERGAAARKGVTSTTTGRAAAQKRVAMRALDPERRPALSELSAAWSERAKNTPSPMTPVYPSPSKAQEASNTQPATPCPPDRPPLEQAPQTARSAPASSAPGAPAQAKVRRSRSSFAMTTDGPLFRPSLLESAPADGSAEADAGAASQPTTLRRCPARHTSTPHPQPRAQTQHPDNTLIASPTLLLQPLSIRAGGARAPLPAALRLRGRAGQRRRRLGPHLRCARPPPPTPLPAY